jgi:hypothetical protein
VCATPARYTSHTSHILLAYTEISIHAVEISTDKVYSPIFDNGISDKVYCNLLYIKEHVMGVRVLGAV